MAVRPWLKLSMENDFHLDPSINLLEAEQVLVKVLNEVSGGQFKITLHPAPELVPPNNVFDAISKAASLSVEMAQLLAGKNTAFDLLVPTHGNVPV